MILGGFKASLMSQKYHVKIYDPDKQILDKCIDDRSKEIKKEINSFKCFIHASTKASYLRYK